MPPNLLQITKVTREVVELFGMSVIDCPGFTGM